MTQVLQIGTRTITKAELVPLLGEYLMLPQLWRELVIDSAIAEIELTPQEQALALEQFEKKHQLTTPKARRAWLARHGLAPEQLEAVATRALKIEKFKLATWGSRIESYFLKYKSTLDKVVYSLLRTQDPEIAQELFFRIQAKEQSFAELAREYSQGSEAQTDGLVGPVHLSMLHPDLAKVLSISQFGQLWPPTRLGEWFAIVRLERVIPAVLDETTQQQLLNSLFEAWIEEQLSQLHGKRIQDTSSSLVAV